MNIDALRHFCEVVRNKSFSRAASEIRMTQSAVSQNIQGIERELGVPLFDRTHRPPQLTPAGEKLFEGLRDILGRLDRLFAHVQDDGLEVRGQVHVASIYSIGMYHTDEIKKFMEIHPKVNVRLQYLRPNLVIEAVLRGDAILGLLSYPRESREIEVIPWLQEEMVLVCPPNHRLAKATNVQYADLSDEKFIAFDNDLAARKHVDTALLRHKVDVDIVMQLDNVETMKQAVQIGLGVSILPESTIQQAVSLGTLARVPLPGKELVRPVGIIRRKDQRLPRAAERFISVLTSKENGESTAPTNPAAEEFVNDPLGDTHGPN